MIVGFISLLLTFGQNYIAKICIPVKLAETMLPCRLETTTFLAGHAPPAGEHGSHPTAENETPVAEHGSAPTRHLLWNGISVDSMMNRRFLSGGGGGSSCPHVCTIQIPFYPIPNTQYPISNIIYKQSTHLAGKSVTCFNRWFTSTAYLYFLLGCISCGVQCHNHGSRSRKGHSFIH